MKRTFVLSLVLAVFVLAALVIWTHRNAPAPAKPSVAQAAPVPEPPKPAPAPLMDRKDWVQYRNVREAALAANPGLQAEHDAIIKDMDAQQAKFDAAMLKADPLIAPVLKKLALLRQHNSANPSSPAGSPAPTPLTPEEMQQLRAARVKAQSATPALVANAKALSDRMQAYQAKLNAAMLKLNPSASSSIAKFDNAAPASPRLQPPTTEQK